MVLDSTRDAEPLDCIQTGGWRVSSSAKLSVREVFRASELKTVVAPKDETPFPHRRNNGRNILMK